MSTSKTLHSAQEASDEKHLSDTYESTYVRRPIRTLAALFLIWKVILFPVIASCPGLGYDTSTSLLTVTSTSLPTIYSFTWSPTSLLGLCSSILKFVRWDAIYFVRVAERGYLFEQEWAWGYGYTRLLKYLSSGFMQSDADSPIISIAISGIAISHLGHFLSVLALHALTKLLFGHETKSQKVFSLISAALHIISPAGAFLSAPYSESLFSFLNFSGFYLYSSALLAESAGHRGRRDISFLLAGVVFSVATTIRGNGIISGSLFAYDAVQGAFQFLYHGPSIDVIRRTAFVVLGGIIVALGTIIPQYIAYTEYCGLSTGSTLRPWCKQLLPSIYSWVQVYYWNNGFLKYWTVSNLPLFILAAPVLATMHYSSFVALTKHLGPFTPGQTSHVPSVSQQGVRRLAIAQGILAIMALTTLHVQIINRIASGYPVWYWYLATTALGESKWFPIAVRGMAMYALIQAVLFGSFLPPA